MDSQAWTFNSLLTELCALPGPVCFIPLSGNNGDRLIELGAREILKSRDDITEEAAMARSVVINGNGVLTHEADVSYFDEIELVRAIKSAGSLPLCLMPFSVSTSNALRLVKLLNSRGAPTTCFVREHFSEQALRSAACQVGCSQVVVRCTHDLAFALAGSDFLERLRRVERIDHVLLVERFDSECVTERPVIFQVSPRARGLVPSQLRRFLKSFLLERSYRTTTLARQVVSQLRPPESGLPFVCNDISLPQNVPFEDFCSTIARSAVVYSTRLHVAILSALMGKRTTLIPGANHKFEGIFEMSLKHLQNVSIARLP